MCLHVGVGGHFDLRTVVAALAQHRVDFVDPVEHASNLAWVEHFVQARGVSEVPGVNEHVGEDERHHCFVHSMVADHRMIEAGGSLLGIVQQ